MFEKGYFKTAEQELDFALGEGDAADYDINTPLDSDADKEREEKLSRACSPPSAKAESDVLPRQDSEKEIKKHSGSALPPAPAGDVCKPSKFCLHRACTRYKQTHCGGYCFKHGKHHLGPSIKAKFRRARKCKHGSCTKYRQKGSFCHAHAKLYAAGPPTARAGVRPACDTPRPLHRPPRAWPAHPAGTERRPRAPSRPT